MTQPVWDDVGNTNSFSCSDGAALTQENWVRDFIDSRDSRAVNQQESVDLLTAEINRLHGDFSICHRYVDALMNALHFVPQDQILWGWFPLMDTPLIRVGLISVYPNFPIPLHDHPNAWGIQKIISGKVRIRQYHFASNSDHRHSLASLEQASDQILTNGQCSSFTPSLRNLHELESYNTSCVLLSVMVNPYVPEDRFFYYQVPLMPNGKVQLYNRIGKLNG